MSYDAVLEVIARLQTQPEFRTAFGDDPVMALQEFGLSVDARERLAQLPARELSLLDAMARFHRWTRIQEHVTWLDPFRRPSLRPLLERFMNATPPHLLNRDDALAFCRWVEAVDHCDASPSAKSPETLGSQNEQNDYSNMIQDGLLKALCQFERLRIEVAWGLVSHPQPLQVTFEYPVQTLSQWLAEHENGWPEVSREPVRVSFVKVPALPAVLVRSEPETTASGREP